MRTELYSCMVDVTLYSNIHHLLIISSSPLDPQIIPCPRYRQIQITIINATLTYIYLLIRVFTEVKV